MCNNELLPISGQPTHMSSMMCSATTEASKILLPSWRVYESKSAPMIGWSTLNTAKTLSLLIFYIFLKCVPSYSDIATMMVGVGIANRTNTSAQLHTSDLSASDNFWMSCNLHPAILQSLSIYMIMEGTATRCTGFQYIASCNCSPLHSTSLRSIFKTNLPSSNQSWQWKTPLIYIYK